MTRVRVITRGFDKVAARMNRSLWAEPATRHLLQGAGRVVQKTAQRAAKPHSGDKGTLGRAIILEVSSVYLEATVAPTRSVMGVAYTIEHGRRPGRRPPYRPIKAWMISHGLVTGARGDSKKVQQMRERMRLVGTKGVGFMEAGAVAGDQALKQGIPATEREIKTLWDRP